MTEFVNAQTAKVIKGLECCKAIHIYLCSGCPYHDDDVDDNNCQESLCSDALELLKAQRETIDELISADKALKLMKEQEKKQITLHKKHVITWGRSDEFSMRKLYETICETLLDEGELIIARTDDHEKVDFVFYVAEGR